MTSAEEWRPVRGWETRYEVSSHGRVRKYDGTVIGQWLNHDGYCLVRLASPRSTQRVHRLVAEAFLEGGDRALVVNHKDADRTNNRLDNLEWCTQPENMQHARNSGRLNGDHSRGIRPVTAKLTDDQVEKIRVLAAGGVPQRALGDQFGVSKRTIFRIVHRHYYATVLTRGGVS